MATRLADWREFFFYYRICDRNGNLLAFLLDTLHTVQTLLIVFFFLPIALFESFN